LAEKTKLEKFGKNQAMPRIRADSRFPQELLPANSRRVKSFIAVFSLIRYGKSLDRSAFQRFNRDSLLWKPLYMASYFPYLLDRYIHTSAFAKENY